jgi:predicted RNA binding protein YcfA (HicA-like mRNA interferase family)
MNSRKFAESGFFADTKPQVYTSEKVYSPECVEEEFSEVRIHGVLRSSPRSYGLGRRSWRDLQRVHGVGCSVMGRRRKLYDRIVGGQSYANIPFEQTVNMLKSLGFQERISGSHHIFTRENIEEAINLQNVGGECKPYQVKQMRTVLRKYNLREEL